MNIPLGVFFSLIIITACIICVFALAELFKNSRIPPYHLPGRNRISWYSGGNGFVLQELKVNDSGIVVDERRFATVYGHKWVSLPNGKYCFNAKELKAEFKKMEKMYGSYYQMVVAVDNRSSCIRYRVGDVYIAD